MEQFPIYSFCLREAGNAVVARSRFKVESDEEAAALAAVLFSALSDVVERCELWCGDREIPLPRRTPTAAQLNAHLQKLVIDQEIALRDTRQKIAQSRRLLDQISIWLKESAI